jgi:hypothetical protein
MAEDLKLALPLAIAGTAATGVLGALVLVAADAVNRRIRVGYHFWAPVRWYFACGFRSILLWIVTAIALTFVVVIIEGVLFP